MIHPGTFLMLFADARLPSGGHAFSAGLEPALRGGLEPARVPEYLVGRARTTSIVDAGTAVAALAACKSAPLTDDLTAVTTQRLNAVIAAWAARTPSAAQRTASRQTGRAYFRVVSSLWPTDSQVGALRNLVAPPRPVVVGVAAAAAGIESEDLARLCIYDDCQTAGAALLKLDPVDPVLILNWVLTACAAAEELLPLAATVIDPDAIPAFGAPQAEGWAESHALLTSRLFHA